jgi:cell division protein FtsW (lipid II flippase)
MYDWLLFFHLIAVFLLGVTVVVYSAVALGATAPGRTLFVADRCWDVGGLGTLIFGIWLALNVDQYDFFDGWILLAIALWLVATGLGQSLQRRVASGATTAVATTHWLRTLVIIGLLAVMIWKPGA